eukprot:5273441-Alexandrium_andersonii.AAC.1
MASGSVGPTGASSSSSEITTGGSWPLSRTTCRLRSPGSLVTVSRTARRSASSCMRKCAPAATDWS